MLSAALRRFPAFAVVFGLALMGHAASRGDELFVADRATNRILSFDPSTGAFNRVVVSLGLNLPTSLAFGPGGDLYVGNLGSGEIERVDPVTGASATFGFIGGVGGLAYDAASNTLFASEFGEFNGDEVYQFNAAGSIIKVIGTGGPATGRAGLAIRGGNLYVSEFGSGQFFVGSVLKYDIANNFAPLGVVAFDAPNSDPFDPSLLGANGLAFNAAGQLYVAGLISQVGLKFSIAGGPATSGVPFAFPMAYPSGVVVEKEGGTEFVYITSLGNDNLQDPIYTGFLFPGAIYKYNVANGALVGGGPLVSSGGAADFDNDGDVDGGDLTQWKNSAAIDGGADADNDLDSDAHDFLAWQRNLGQLGDFQPTAAVIYKTAIAAAVPEPAAVALAVAGFLGVASARRRRGATAV